MLRNHQIRIVPLDGIGAVLARLDEESFRSYTLRVLDENACLFGKTDAEPRVVLHPTQIAEALKQVMLAGEPVIHGCLVVCGRRNGRRVVLQRTRLWPSPHREACDRAQEVILSSISR